MVSPYAPTNESDCSAREHHEWVSEEWLLGENRKYFRDNAEARQNEDVHLGVSEDPEQVLPQQWVGTCRYIEERCTKVALEAQEEKRHGDNWHCEQQEELHH